MDPYATLELPYTATTVDINKAYRRLAKLWHPDTNEGSLEAAEMFRKVKAAFDCLKDPIKRKEADLDRKYREQADATKKAKAKADRQTRAGGYAQPPPSDAGFGPLGALFVFLAFVFIIVALFDSSNGGSNSTTV